MKAAFLCNGYNGGKDNINKAYGPQTQAEIGELFDLYPGVYTKDDIAKIPDIECAFSTWGFPDFTEEEIKKYLPKLKIVFYGAGSVQRFARPLLNCGIKVISAWMANGVPVAEYSVAQIILANKGFFMASRMARSPESREQARLYGLTLPGNYDIRVGLIGLGAIGTTVAEMLKSYNFNVCAYDPFASEEKCRALNVTSVSLEELFSTCQTISNHVANLPETVGMLNGKLFDMMLPNATFINTGRGAQVVEADLIAALKAEPNRTAVLDVTLPEPPEEGSELYTLPNVFLTPHLAGSAGRECMRMGQYMLEESRRYLNDEPLKYSVSLKMLETMA